MGWFSYLVAGIMVYVAVAVFLVGMGYRIYQWLNAPKTRIRTGVFPKKASAGARGLQTVRDALLFPQTLQTDRWMWMFTILFHLGLLGALVGHLRLIHELTPLATLLGPEGMDQLSLLGGGIMGVILMIALAYYLFRRFISPYKELSAVGDYMLLILLIAIVVMGNHMRFAGHISAGVYRDYVQSLLAFRPTFPEALAESSIKSALVYHVLFANLLLIYFPFSKLVHVIATFPANLARRR
jgi:nitrate reductase gamma subunit